MNKVRYYLTIAIALAGASGMWAQLTLPYCMEKAKENYPLIHKYGIVEKLNNIELSDIDKAWLPQGSLYAQGTLQNSVPEFPSVLSKMLEQMGQDFKGLAKFQYKIGLDVTQTIWDGGASKARRETARADAAQQSAALDVQMYKLNERVQSLYFGLLLIQSQIEQTHNTLKLIEKNLDRIKVMYRNGTAMQCDVDILEAQRLAILQQLVSAEESAKEYRAMLEVLIGEPTDGKSLEMPADVQASALPSDRPELKLFDSQITANKTKEAAIKAGLMPKIGFFGSIYYGYPGYNYFEAMRNRNMSFNAIAGVKASWDIGSLYNRKNKLNKLALANEQTEADRELFLFDSRLRTAGSNAEIESMRKVMRDDSRIVELRGNVRRAAESQLENGVIDATDLLAKITDENQARITEAYHKIRLLQLIYQHNNILNR